MKIGPIEINFKWRKKEYITKEELSDVANQIVDDMDFSHLWNAIKKNSDNIKRIDSTILDDERRILKIEKSIELMTNILNQLQNGNK